MSFRATHELHHRRIGRNVGLALVLVAFIGIIFGLTVVKVTNGSLMQGFDHVPRASVLPVTPSSTAPTTPTSTPSTQGD
jgi:hypothetical protein